MRTDTSRDPRWRVASGWGPVLRGVVAIGAVAGIAANAVLLVMALAHAI